MPMGHGASTRTNVKSISIQDGVAVSKSSHSVAAEPCKTPRSSSDGCIVETLNSSKCRAELLEIQVEEYKELLRLKECKQVETQDRATLHEAQLAEVEGKNFELTDRVTELEQQLEALQSNNAPRAILEVEEDEVARLEQQLESKELNIEKLEYQVKSLEADLKKMRSKFKKRLKAAQMETAEVRQESALKVYSLKDEIKKVEEENTKLIARLDRASSATRSRQGSAAVPNARTQTIEEEEDKLEEWEDGRTKLIVELSNQVSAQEELINDLQQQLEKKEADLKEVQMMNGDGARPKSGHSRKSSAKSDRIAPIQKSYWGYSGNDPSTTDQSGQDLKWSPKSPDDDNDILCNPKQVSSRVLNRKSSAGHRVLVTKSPDDEDDDFDIPRKSSSREQSGKSSAGSQKLFHEQTDDDLSIKQTQRLSLRGGSKKNSRNSSAVSNDSVLSANSENARSRTSLARKSSAGSSRQRRRLQAAVEDSSRYSPNRTDSVLSNTSAISRTKDGKDSGIDIHSVSYRSDFTLDGNDNVDKLMKEIVGFPSYDSNM